MEFKEGRIQILVATTVIEVGIDIPNASVMVVEHAERFGLSQLHQLRGRIGRGRYPSKCILLAQYRSFGGGKGPAPSDGKDSRWFSDCGGGPGTEGPGRIPWHPAIRTAGFQGGPYPPGHADLD